MYRAARRPVSAAAEGGPRATLGFFSRGWKELDRDPSGRAPCASSLATMEILTMSTVTAVRRARVRPRVDSERQKVVVRGNDEKEAGDGA
eukprot:7150862-Pyramimonas_sp.AAC.1